MKLKRMPSLRMKKRYVTFRLHSKRPVVYSEMRGAALNGIMNWLGEGDFSQSHCRIIRNLWDHAKQTGWLECSAGMVDDIKVALALVHQIGDERVIFQVLRVSGTIKSGKEKIFKHQG